MSIYIYIHMYIMLLYGYILTILYYCSIIYHSAILM